MTKLPPNTAFLPAALMPALLAAAPIAAQDKLTTDPAEIARAAAIDAADMRATATRAVAPSEIIDTAPKADWTAIPASDLLVMDLTPDAKRKPRRVVIQLMPAPFSQGWIGNIRKLAKARWWDGLSINRVQDNYVVQWGDADGEDKAKAKALPQGLIVTPEREYTVPYDEAFMGVQMPYAEDAHFFSQSCFGGECEEVENYPPATKFALGFAFATNSREAWPVHCYGMVGVGRNLSPDTGSGAEFYTVIGHAPRHLDRNIALVGRVIEGIEHLSSLPRGTGPLGFYETPEERTAILSVRMGNEVTGLPAYEYLSTESQSFAAYADARANRRDAFFIRPAGGADVCNIPVPVRRVKG